MHFALECTGSPPCSQDSQSGSPTPCLHSAQLSLLSHPAWFWKIHSRWIGRVMSLLFNALSVLLDSVVSHHVNSSWPYEYSTMSATPGFTLMSISNQGSLFNESTLPHAWREPSWVFSFSKYSLSKKSQGCLQNGLVIPCCASNTTEFKIISILCGIAYSQSNSHTADHRKTIARKSMASGT